MYMYVNTNGSISTIEANKEISNQKVFDGIKYTKINKINELS